MTPTRYPQETSFIVDVGPSIILAKIESPAKHTHCPQVLLARGQGSYYQSTRTSKFEKRKLVHHGPRDEMGTGHLNLCAQNDYLVTSDDSTGSILEAKGGDWQPQWTRTTIFRVSVRKNAVVTYTGFFPLAPICYLPGLTRFVK